MDRITEPLRHGRHAESAFLLAVVVGLVASAVHWAGLVLGGALVGFVAPTLRRSLVTGLFFGFTVFVAFLVYLLVVGAASKYAAMGMLLYLSVAIAVLLPPIAALAVRGLTAVGRGEGN
ncbi:MAG: hypothetical protein V5A43_09505 [Haloarculaceae archaeon]